MKEGAPLQLAFFDAKPFGWFLLNAGKAGYFDCCWAISAVPRELIEMMLTCFREMKQQNQWNSWDAGFPAVLVLADRTGTVFEVTPLEMDQNSWHLFCRIRPRLMKESYRSNRPDSSADIRKSPTTSSIARYGSRITTPSLASLVQKLGSIDRMNAVLL
jgi:hypothetical protein